MAGYGVVGQARGGPQGRRVIRTNLDDLYQKAVQEESDFYLYVSVPKDPDQGIMDVLEWAIDQGVWYKPVYERGWSDDMAMEAASDKQQVADYETAMDSVVGTCVRYELALLVLYKEDEVLDGVIGRALAEGLEANALNDGAFERLEFEDEEPSTDEEDEDVAADEEEWTAEAVLALGDEADGGDEDAAGQLQQWAEEAGMDPDAYGTWAELAVALAEAMEGGEDDDPNAERRAELEAMKIRELRSLALAQGWNGNKMSAEEIVPVLLGEVEPPEAEEAPAPAPAKKAAKTAKKAAAPGRAALNGSGDPVATTKVIIEHLRGLADAIEAL